MSQVQVIAAHVPVDFDSHLSSVSISYNDKATAIVDRILASGHDTSATNCEGIEDFSVPGLPPVHHGYPDTHLRNGVMQAGELTADGEPDAEKAFFVADLSYVYHQHLRWKRFLPEIEPFYGVFSYWSRMIRVN